jgi:hypothetical protein
MGYDPWCHGGRNASMSMVTTQMCDVYLLLPMCHVYIQGRRQSSVLAFVNLFVATSMNFRQLQGHVFTTQENKFT